jgi:hypothetical protein
MTFAAKMHEAVKSKPLVEIFQEELKIEDELEANHNDIEAMIEASNPSRIDGNHVMNRLNPFSPLLHPGEEIGNARNMTEDILPPSFSVLSNENSVSNQGLG